MRYSIQRPHADYALRGRTIEGSAIDGSLSILASLDRPFVSLAMGSPAPDAIPVAALAELSRRLLAGANAVAALDYTPTEGDSGLRAALLRRLEAEGLDLHPRNLLVTAGGMQGLDLVAKLFVDPDDLVAVESPSYANGLATLRNYGAELLPIPVDDEGIVVDVLADAIAGGRVPRLVYTIPSFQNPSGTTASLRRRQALLELAQRYRMLILEDDPYSELRYSGDALPSLLELDASGGRVVQVRTFSKIVSPGLRVGWVVAPADTIDRMVRAKQSMDTCANSLGQGLVRLMIEDDLLDAHVDALRRLYPMRRDAMLLALSELVPVDRGFSWTDPAGGMFIWLRLPDGLSGDDLAIRSLDHGVAVVPGSAFTLRRNEPAVRLCFSSIPERSIVPAISSLAEALNEMLVSGARADGQRPMRGMAR